MYAFAFNEPKISRRLDVDDMKKRGKMPTHLEKQQARDQTNAAAKATIELEAKKLREKSERLRELRRSALNDKTGVSG